MFRSEELFSMRHTTYVLWDDGVDRVWVYSGDIGIYLYDVDADGRWVSSTWTELSRPEPPPALAAARPEMFP